MTAFNIDIVKADVDRHGMIRVEKPEDLRQLDLVTLNYMFNKYRGDRKTPKVYRKMTHLKMIFNALKENAKPLTPKAGYRGHRVGSRMEQLHRAFDEEGLSRSQFVQMAVDLGYSRNSAFVLYYEFKRIRDAEFETIERES